MSSRFQLATKGVTDLVAKVRGQHFPELATAEILVMLDKQKSTTKGRINKGRLTKANSTMNTLAEHLDERSYDYVLIMDRQLWETLSSEDRTRLVYHILCAGWKATENEEDKYKLAAPDYQVFAKEVDYWPDWRDWHRRMNEHAAKVHETSDPPHSGQANLGDYIDQQDNTGSAYWNESEAALKDMAAERGLALPEGFDARSDEDRVGYLVKLLELSDKERADQEREAAA